MTPTRTLLVPLDGSLLSKRALPYAIALARAAGGRLLLLRVLEPEAAREQRGCVLDLIGRRALQVEAVDDELCDLANQVGHVLPTLG